MPRISEHYLFYRYSISKAKTTIAQFLQRSIFWYLKITNIVKSKDFVGGIFDKKIELKLKTKMK